MLPDLLLVGVKIVRQRYGKVTTSILELSVVISNVIVNYLKGSWLRQ